MKIIAFDVRFDELVHFDKIKKSLGLEVVSTEDPITKENIHLTEGAYGISILAYAQIDKEIIDMLRKNGVEHISTRTVGVNHIDVAYAEQKGMLVTNSSYKPDGVAEIHPHDDASFAEEIQGSYVSWQCERLFPDWIGWQRNQRKHGGSDGYGIDRCCCDPLAFRFRVQNSGIFSYGEGQA